MVAKMCQQVCLMCLMVDQNKSAATQPLTKCCTKEVFHYILKDQGCAHSASTCSRKLTSRFPLSWFHNISSLCPVVKLLLRYLRTCLAISWSAIRNSGNIGQPGVTSTCSAHLFPSPLTHQSLGFPSPLSHL